MSVVDDLDSFLETQGIAGGSTTWTLLRRRVTDEPAEDQLVVLTEDGGLSPEISEDEGIGDSALADMGVLVTVRAGAWDGDASFDKAMEIFTALHGQLDVLLGSNTYMRVRARTAEPVFIGFDDQGRPRHTIAFLLLAEQ